MRFRHVVLHVFTCEIASSKSVIKAGAWLPFNGSLARIFMMAIHDVFL